MPELTWRSRAGEFFTMLGPSGSGKTTTLRMIAGFEDPSAGTIELAGEDVSGVPPYERAVNTVFQDYALFPHMTVAENVAYGLRGGGRRQGRAGAPPRRGAGDGPPARLRRPQAGRALRRPAPAGRARAGDRQPPQVLLLDEPLGALDLKLREQMQVELKRIQGEVGITFVYVTHDQDEALTMSDRIAVFNEGGSSRSAGRWSSTRPRQRVRRRLRRGLQRDRARRGQLTIRPEKISCSSRRCRRRRAADRTRPDRGHRL